MKINKIVNVIWIGICIFIIIAFWPLILIFGPIAILHLSELLNKKEENWW